MRDDLERVLRLRGVVQPLARGQQRAARRRRRYDVTAQHEGEALSEVAVAADRLAREVAREHGGEGRPGPASAEDDVLLVRVRLDAQLHRVAGARDVDRRAGPEREEGRELGAERSRDRGQRSEARRRLAGLDLRQVALVKPVSAASSSSVRRRARRSSRSCRPMSITTESIAASLAQRALAFFSQRTYLHPRSNASVESRALAAVPFLFRRDHQVRQRNGDLEAGMGAYRVSMDIGGTFTDVVAYDTERGRTRPASRPRRRTTSPRACSPGSAQVIGSPAEIDFTVHGTTQGLNAFLQRRGERVLLLATAGAGHVYHIARGDRHRLYDLHYRKPEPLVPLGDIVEIRGRLAYTGEELDAARRGRRSAPPRGVRATRASARSPSPSSSATSTPRTSCGPSEILREELGEVPVSLSHRVAREWREYERTSSTVIDAYTAPVVRRYLRRLEDEMRAGGLSVPLHVMQSNGGILTAESARDRPLQTLLSGPVGGTMGARRARRDARPAEPHRHRHGRHVASTSRWSSTARRTSPPRRRSRASRCS